MVWSISKLTISARTTWWPSPSGTKIYLIFAFLFMHSPKIWFVHPLYSGMIVSSLAFRLVHFSGPIAIPLTAIGYQFIPENVYGILRLQRLCMLQSTVIIVVRSTGARSTEFNRLRYVHRCMMYTSRGIELTRVLRTLCIFCIFSAS